MENWEKIVEEGEPSEYEICLHSLRKLCVENSAEKVIENAVDDFILKAFPFGINIDLEAEDEIKEGLTNVLKRASRLKIGPPLSIYIDALLAKAYQVEKGKPRNVARTIFLLGVAFKELTAGAENKETKKAYG